MSLEHLRELTPVVALLAFEHWKTQQLAVFKQAVFFTIHFSFLMHTF